MSVFYLNKKYKARNLFLFIFNITINKHELSRRVIFTCMIPAHQVAYSRIVTQLISIAERNLEVNGLFKSKLLFLFGI